LNAIRIKKDRQLILFSKAKKDHLPSNYLIAKMLFVLFY